MSTATPSSIRHPIAARLYVRQSAAAEQRGMADQRQELLAGLSGRVLEVGAGNGMNFAHYPAEVTQVLAIEPEPLLRAHAESVAAGAPVAVSVVDGVAEALPVADASVDAVVVSLVLCSVADPQRAIAEAFRVVRPGGELRFNEHVVSERPGRARLQRALDATIWPTLSGGCHLARDTGAALRAGGFVVEQERRFCFDLGPLDPAKAHILGRARRPA